MPKAASKPPLPPAPFLGNLASGTMPIPTWTKTKSENLARDVAFFRGATLKRDIRYGFATELHKGAKVDLVVDLLGDGRIDLVHDDYLATIGRVMPLQLQRGPRATPYAAGGSRRPRGGVPTPRRPAASWAPDPRQTFGVPDRPGLHGGGRRRRSRGGESPKAT